MRKNLTAGVFFAVWVALSLGGCTVITAAKARLEPREHFLTSSHAQVLYQSGSEGMARRMAMAIDASVGKVERTHEKKFLQPPRVYVCDAPCFSRFSTLHESVPAGHFMDSVFMNDSELRNKERKFNIAPEKFLVHELTHLLFYQHVGPLAYMRTPAWFREGWAVLVSEGAGAQASTPFEAARYVLSGSSIDPTEEGSVFWNKTASAYGLPYPVFYRQAGMFVSYLKELDMAAFHAALHDLFRGADFQKSFERAYGRPIAAYWPDFKKKIQTRIGDDRVLE